VSGHENIFVHRFSIYGQCQVIQSQEHFRAQIFHIWTMTSYLQVRPD